MNNIIMNEYSNTCSGHHLNHFRVSGRLDCCLIAALSAQCINGGMHWSIAHVTRPCLARTFFLCDPSITDALAAWRRVALG